MHEQLQQEVVTAGLSSQKSAFHLHLLQPESEEQKQTLD